MSSKVLTAVALAALLACETEACGTPNCNGNTLNLGVSNARGGAGVGIGGYGGRGGGHGKGFGGGAFAKGWSANAYGGAGGGKGGDSEFGNAGSGTGVGGLAVAKSLLASVTNGGLGQGRGGDSIWGNGGNGSGSGGGAFSQTASLFGRLDANGGAGNGNGGSSQNGFGGRGTGRGGLAFVNNRNSRLASLGNTFSIPTVTPSIQFSTQSGYQQAGYQQAGYQQAGYQTGYQTNYQGLTNYQQASTVSQGCLAPNSQTINGQGQIIEFGPDFCVIRDQFNKTFRAQYQKCSNIRHRKGRNSFAIRDRVQYNCFQNGAQIYVSQIICQ